MREAVAIDIAAVLGDVRSFTELFAGFSDCPGFGFGAKASMASRIATILCG